MCLKHFSDMMAKDPSFNVLLFWLHYICKANVSIQMLNKQAYKIISSKSLGGAAANIPTLKMTLDFTCLFVLPPMFLFEKSCAIRKC